MDTGAWSGLFGKVHEERRQSGLSVAQFSWQTAQPRYAQKVKTAEARPKQSTLTLKPDRTFTAAPGYHLYEVHHLVDDIPLFGTGAAETYWTQDRKRHFWQVSIVEAKDLEHLFELTNSFDGPWTAGSHVLWKSSEHLRSTSVGDVVMDMQSHQTCIVAPHGFRELMPPTAEA